MHNIIRCRKIIFLSFAAPKKKKNIPTNIFFSSFIAKQSKQDGKKKSKNMRLYGLAKKKNEHFFRFVDFIVCVILVFCFVVIPSNFLRPLPMCVMYV